MKKIGFQKGALNQIAEDCKGGSERISYLGKGGEWGGGIPRSRGNLTRC